jgi:hypothetical protein
MITSQSVYIQLAKYPNGSSPPGKQLKTPLFFLPYKFIYHDGRV